VDYLNFGVVEAALGAQFMLLVISALLIVELLFLSFIVGNLMELVLAMTDVNYV
jgi:hypothetical protein